MSEVYWKYAGNESLMHRNCVKATLKNNLKIN